MNNVTVNIQVELPDHAKDWSYPEVAEYLAGLFISGARNSLLEAKLLCVKESSTILRTEALEAYDQDLRVVNSAVFVSSERTIQ